MITDIQKFSIHDGEGIRTTVFFKGCPLSCSWCHNPETQGYRRELLYYEERCSGCGACTGSCENGAVALVQTADGEQKAVTDRKKCFACGACTDICENDARKICGRDISQGELLKELLKDQPFYETSNGGVTLSGGEVLCNDLDYVVELMSALVKRGISVNIDTCGHTEYSNIEKVFPFTNNFLYDIKLMDSEEHRKYTGVGNELILSNLVRLSAAGGRIWLRLPVIGKVNDTDANMKAVAEFLLHENICQEYINLLPYHAEGSSKYVRLGRCYKDGFTVPSREKIEHIENIFLSYGFRNVISLRVPSQKNAQAERQNKRLC